MPDSTVTRFAPSPTGYLHVGGARTALFNWLLARHSGGKFLLRIEDTDLARSTDEACQQLLEDLRWLGLHWDNQELVFQSKRVAVYDKIIADLTARGLAYEAFDSPEELEAQRRAAETAKRSFTYRRRKLSDAEIARFRSENRPSVIRFAMPVKEYRFRDEVLDKQIVFPAEEAQDFVIRKADGMPTYHFAVVVDDAEMNVTHVLRGQEHLKNTFYHIALQEALGYPRPLYGHLPIIMNIDGSKMSKRDRDKAIRRAAKQAIKNGRAAEELATRAGLPPGVIADWLADDQRQLDLSEQQKIMPVVGLQEADLPEILVHDFRRNGYLPEVLLNFLALLGWSPGGDRERMSIDEMVSLFSVGDIGRSNAKFARDKLLAFNTEACAAAPLDRLIAAMRDYLSVNPDSPLGAATDAELARLLQMKKGFRTLREVDSMTRFFFLPDDQIVFDKDAVEKVLLKNDRQGLTALRELARILAAVPDWNHASIESVVKNYGEEKKLGLGKIAQPIRVAIAGTTVSPPIFESLEFLGKDRTLARIGLCLAAVTPAST
jgi:glutamyl-tRNA synthetase